MKMKTLLFAPEYSPNSITLCGNENAAVCAQVHSQQHYTPW